MEAVAVICGTRGGRGSGGVAGAHVVGGTDEDADTAAAVGDIARAVVSGPLRAVVSGSGGLVVVAGEEDEVKAALARDVAAAAASQLFNLIAHAKETFPEEAVEWSVRGSLAEIAADDGEGITDVLCAASGERNPPTPKSPGGAAVTGGGDLRMRDDPVLGPIIPDLWELSIANAGEVVALLDAFAATLDASVRRAHLLINFTLTQHRAAGTPDAGTPTLQSRLSVLRLARASGAAAGTIPAWVRALSEVLAAVESRSPAAPYGASRVTLLLRDALTGKAGGVFVACAPNTPGTGVAVLQFAKRVEAASRMLVERVSPLPPPPPPPPAQSGAGASLRRPITSPVSVVLSKMAARTTAAVPPPPRRTPRSRGSDTSSLPPPPPPPPVSSIPPPPASHEDTSGGGGGGAVFTLEELAGMPAGAHDDLSIPAASVPAAYVQPPLSARAPPPPPPPHYQAPPVAPPVVPITAASRPPRAPDASWAGTSSTASFAAPPPATAAVTSAAATPAPPTRPAQSTLRSATPLSRTSIGGGGGGGTPAAAGATPRSATSRSARPSSAQRARSAGPTRPNANLTTPVAPVAPPVPPLAASTSSVAGGGAPLFTTPSSGGGMMMGAMAAATSLDALSAVRRADDAASEAASLRTALAAARKQVRDFELYRDVVETAIGRMQGDLARVAAERDAAVKALRATQATLTRDRNALAVARKRAGDAERALAEIGEQLERREDATKLLVALRSRLSAARAASSTTEATLAALREEANSELAMLRARLAASEDGAAEERARADELAVEVTTLRAALMAATPAAGASGRGVPLVAGRSGGGGGAGRGPSRPTSAAPPAAHAPAPRATTAVGAVPVAATAASTPAAAAASASRPSSAVDWSAFAAALRDNGMLPSFSMLDGGAGGELDGDTAALLRAAHAMVGEVSDAVSPASSSYAPSTSTSAATGRGAAAHRGGGSTPAGGAKPVAAAATARPYTPASRSGR